MAALVGKWGGRNERDRAGPLQDRGVATSSPWPLPSPFVMETLLSISSVPASLSTIEPTVTVPLPPSVSCPLSCLTSVELLPLMLESTTAVASECTSNVVVEFAGIDKAFGPEISHEAYCSTITPPRLTELLTRT